MISCSALLLTFMTQESLLKGQNSLKYTQFGWGRRRMVLSTRKTPFF